MPRKTMLLIALALYFPAFSPAAAPAVPRIAWTVETSAPVARRLDLRYGETVDLECRFLSYNTAMDILGGDVTLHARTNGMAEGGSFQYAGAAGSNGLATVRLPVDSWLPQGLTNASWTLECVQTNSVRLLRASGSVTLSGTSATSTNDPLPSVWITNITAQIAAATGALAQASSAAVSNLSASVSLSISNLSDSVDSVNSFAVTNQVTILWDSAVPGIWWEVRGGTNITTKSRTLSGTNLVVTLSGDFLNSGTGLRPAWTNHVWPFSEGGWAGAAGAGTLTITDTSDPLNPAAWAGTLSTGYPVLLTPDGAGPLGSAVVSVGYYVYTTNIISSCNMVTGNVWQAVAAAAQSANDAWEKAADAQSDINGHAPAGTIAAPHLLLGDRALIDSVPGKVNANGGTLTNGHVSGSLTFRNTQATNLVGRTYASNDVLFIEWVNQ